MVNYLIVVMNGPPHSGKSTIIDKLVSSSHPYGILDGKYYTCWHERMINPVREAVMALFSLDPYNFEAYKDDDILLNGMTPRKAVVDADRCLRVALGKGYLAEILIRELYKCLYKTPKTTLNPTQIFLVDCGVEHEYQILKNEFGPAVKVLQVAREGVEFTDSRSYLSWKDGTIYNIDGQLNRAVKDVLLFINDWMEKGYDKGHEGATTGVPEESEVDKPQS